MSLLKSKTFAGSGLITALLASLCCITPVIAMIAGISGMASAFSFMEPLRPYFIGATGLFLAFAWYNKLKPKAEIDCNCEDEKPSFWQTKKFLGIITVFAVLMLSFPYYAHAFYPQQQETEKQTNNSNGFFIVDFAIEGMTCTGCEHHIENALNDVEGVENAKASYKKGNAIVTFDSSKTSISDIKAAINKTGYTVKEDNGKIIENIPEKRD